MRQEKRKQKEVFDPDTASLNHPAATFATTKRKASSIAESTTPTKKQKKSPDEMLKALQKQFRIFIIDELTKSKNKKQTLDTLAARKQMPRVVIAAEDDINCERTDITNWLRRQKEPNVNLFLTYLRDHKDDIMKELESTTVSSAGPSTATGARPPSPTSSMRSTSTSSSTSTAAASTVGASTATETFRSCPASLLSIIRPDLETNARTHIITTLETALTAARDYTVDFSIQISKLVLLFKDHTFELSGKSVTFPSAQGPKINTLLPERFIGNTDHLPPPLSEKVLTSKMYKESLDQLFTLQHLARVHSAYYGAIGSQTTSPYQDALVHVLPKTDDNAAVTTHLTNHIMQKEYDRFNVAFQNMWSGNRFIGLIDRLLLHLLNEHLLHRGPKTQQREKKPPTVSQAPTKDFSFGSKSKGTVDKLIKKEQKTLEKHNEKGRDDRVAKCQARVDLYIKAKEDQRKQRIQAHQDLLAEHKAPTTAATAVTTSQSRDIAVVDPNEEIPVDESIDKSRINDLKTLLKKLLLQDKVATQKYISSQFPGIKDNEMKVITKIIKVIHPYIHLKGKPQFIYKLPLILLANQVLSALGKNRATTPITPNPSCHKLQALFIDTETLFSLFVSSRSDRAMNISTFSNDPITSASKALDHKNAVFGSFFDIRAIHKICQSYNMEFANILHLLPGGKTFTIVGTRSLPPSSNVPPPSDQHPTTHGLSPDDERRATLLKAEKEKSQRQLEQHRKDLSDFHRSTSIRQLKKDFTHTTEAKDAIKIAKEKNRQLEFAVAEDRRAVQLKKQEIQALSWVVPTHQPEFVQSDSCYQRAEDSLLHLEDIQHSTFCGTDNGLVSITETVAFSMDEFNYYINLHNHAHNLDSSNGMLVFHPPPRSFKVNPKNCTHWRGLRDHQNYIKHRKPSHIKQAEKQLSQHSLNVSSVEDLHNNYLVHKSQSPFMRTFYYGRPMIRRRRRLMFKSKKFKQKLCHQERVFIKESTKETHPHHESTDPIMFIGDRGFGIGSRIKGFARVGGSWKAKEHGHYTKVFVTNEYNTSQTCLYCFKKLSHTLKQKNGKLVKNNGSFICYNPECIAFLKVLARDRVSAMAIGIAGLSQVLFGVTIPEFDPHPTRDKSRLFNEKAVEFCKHFQT